jgi:hypothetical protein
MSKKKGPKVLLLDIETSPIISYVWALFDQNIALNQIKTDWHLLSWAAKWLDSDKVMYMDQRNVKNIENDKKLLQHIWKLLDEADVVIWQNGDKFDGKKLNARFIMNGMKPPSSYKTIDTLKLAKKYFGFTVINLNILVKISMKNIKNKVMLNFQDLSYGKNVYLIILKHGKRWKLIINMMFLLLKNFIINWFLGTIIQLTLIYIIMMKQLFVLAEVLSFLKTVIFIHLLVNIKDISVKNVVLN